MAYCKIPKNDVTQSITAGTYHRPPSTSWIEGFCQRKAFQDASVPEYFRTIDNLLSIRSHTQNPIVVGYFAAHKRFCIEVSPRDEYVPLDAR